MPGEWNGDGLMNNVLHMEAMLLAGNQKIIRDQTVMIGGELEISGDGVVLVEHCDLTIAGRLILRDNAQFISRDSMLRFAPRPVFELPGSLCDQASMTLTDTVMFVSK